MAKIEFEAVQPTALEVTVPGGVENRPLAVLPRGAKRALTHTVEIYIEVGKRAAGCAICDHPIPPDCTRIRVKVRLFEPIKNDNGSERHWESYYIHSACVTERIRPEVLRGGFDCYQCGAIAPLQEDGMPLRWDAYCFTTTKFAPAPLCPKCCEKPWWHECGLCTIRYPQWMVSPAARGWNVALANGDVVEVRPGDPVCSWCARRHDILREEERQVQTEEFEKTREMILRDGLFDG